MSVFFVFSLLFLIYQIPTLLEFILFRKSQKWVSTEATSFFLDFKEYYDYDSNFNVRETISFQANGFKFECIKLFWGHNVAVENISGKRFDRLKKKYTGASKVTVFYNPVNPYENIIENNYSDELDTMVTVSTIAGGIQFILLLIAIVGNIGGG